jgi:outer membrane protein assembly factor BamB
VVAVNSSTENLEWAYSILVTTPGGGLSCGETSVPTAIYSTPVVDKGIVYVGTYSGQVLALSMLARSQDLSFPQQRYGEWEWNCPADNAKSTAIVANLLLSGDSIYVSSSNGRVYSLDKEFGDLNWRSNVLDERHGKLWTSPASRNYTLYVSTYDGHIYSLSSETGGLSDWSFESEAGFASSPMVYEDTVFLGAFDRYLYAVNVTVGSDEPTWRFPQEEPARNWFWATPVIDGGVVYAGCLDGTVYAIEARTGQRLWEFDTEDPIVTSPVLMDSLLIVINESGTMYVFDTELADEAVPLESISIGADVRSSYCAQGGLVCVRGEDNQLYVVDIDTGGVWRIDLNTEEQR